MGKGFGKRQQGFFEKVKNVIGLTLLFNGGNKITARLMNANMFLLISSKKLVSSRSSSKQVFNQWPNSQCRWASSLLISGKSTLRLSINRNIFTNHLKCASVD